MQPLPFALLGHPSVVVVVFDRLGKVTQLSPGFADTLGGQIDNFFEVAGNVEPALSCMEPDGALSLVVQCTDAEGKVLWFRASITREQDDCFVAVMSDMTEERRLAELNRRKDEVFAMVSHEIRSPLTGIRNAVTILNYSKTISPHERETLAIIDNQSKRIATILDDLLDCIRSTQGKLNIRKEIVDLCECMRRAALTVASLIAQREHHLHISIPSTPALAVVDSARMEQVLVNLLTNAAKYTDTGGNIEFGMTVDEGRAKITVEEDGIGITADKIPYIFDMFVQDKRGHAHRKGGLGIGLAIVRSLVQLQGGTVEAFSDGENRGSRFVVTIPIEESVASECKGSATILVIEDRPESSGPLIQLLTMSGHKVHLSCTGKDGIQKATLVDPDVVLLDMGLPDMSGIDVARILKQNLPWTTIVALTGEPIEEEARSVGCSAYFRKPIDFDQLAAYIIDAVFGYEIQENPRQ